MQKYFNDNGEHLNSVGLYYPVHDADKNGISGGHWSLVDFLKSGNILKAKEFIEENIRIANNRNLTLLLSSEHFVDFASDFFTLLQGISFHIISFYRHPIECFVSSYNQDVKRHYLKLKLEEYSFSNAPLKPRITGESLLNWLNYFSVNSVYVVFYKKEFNVVNKFFEVLGINSTDFDSRINKSYTPSALNLKRIFNKLISIKDEKFNASLDQVLQHYSDSIDVVYPSYIDTLGGETYAYLERIYAPYIQLVQDKFKIKVCLSESAPCGRDIDSLDDIFKLIKKNRETYDFFRKKLLFQLSNSPIDSDFYLLIYYFEIGSISNNSFQLSDATLRNILSDDLLLPDLLREFSILLSEIGCHKSAYKVIDKALELRPSGPVIQQLHRKLACIIE
ncbi:hypothetical protein [Oceaniserpentilla sp. 4NH20-0058]|uniref:hypothetical protein n=1 Tax=Oceaniserpentilla sp. 4NH20-0058 TaxID=3127660 RepID=UPI0033405A94